MTLTVRLALSPDLEARLRAGIAERDRERVRQVLVDALGPTVEALLQQPTASVRNDEEWETIADQLADAVAASIAPNTPALSEYAVSRAGIDEDHP